MIDNVIIRHKLSSQGKITAYVLGIVNDSLYGIAPTISTLGSVALLSPLIISHYFKIILLFYSNLAKKIPFIALFISYNGSIILSLTCFIDIVIGLT